MSPAGRAAGIDALAGEEDRITGGFGELLDAGRDVDGVTNQSELQLAFPADSSGDHQTGVDSDADSQCIAESLGDETVNQHTARTAASA